MQTVSLNGRLELLSHEAIVLDPYLDSVNVPTIGAGHTKAAGDPVPVIGGTAITLTTALKIFTKDLADYERDVRAAFTVPLTAEQFDAAVSFHYNTGGIYRASWVKHVNSGDRVKARKAFMNWRKPKEIIPRRQKERDLFFDGTYTCSDFVSVYRASKMGQVQWSGGRKENARELLTKMEQASAPKSSAKNTGNAKVAGITGAIALAAGAVWTWGEQLWDAVWGVF